jgi:hypothetical protein
MGDPNPGGGGVHRHLANIGTNRSSPLREHKSICYQGNRGPITLPHNVITIVQYG